MGFGPGDVINWLGSGANNYRAQPVDVLQGTTPEQIQGVFQGGQGLQGQQQSLADYLAQRAQQGNPLDFAAAQGALGQGDQLLAQTMDAAQGRGPNPALEQLKQTTGQNIQQAAGMVASSRGVNPAMAARTAAMTGANMNQQAAGQAATLSAQQQIAARQQAGQLAGQQASQYAGLTQAQEAAQQGRLGMSADQLAGMGAQNLQQQQILQGALANFNNARVSQQTGMNQVNAGVAQQNAQIGSQMFGGLMQGAGAALGLADGGEVPPMPSYLSLGAPQLTPPTYTPGPSEGAGPRSAFGRTLMAIQTPVAPISTPQAPQPAASDGAYKGGQAMGAGLAKLGMMAFASEGGAIPGRSQVAGDSERNDVVPAALSPGEFVVKRSVAQQPGMTEALHAINNEPGVARDFVKFLIAREGEGFGKVLAARGAKKMNEGGEVKQGKGVLESLKTWWAAKPADSQAASRGVADAIHAALPDTLSGRSAVRRHEADLEAAYAAAKGE
jgi:hypothetical protein